MKKYLNNKQNLIKFKINELNNLKDYVNYYWHIDKVIWECEKIIEKKALNYLDLLTVEHTVDTLIKIASWNIILD